MMPTLKVAHRIFLLPTLAAVALGLAVATIAWMGRSDLRTLARIRTGHYPAVELMHSLQGVHQLHCGVVAGPDPREGAQVAAPHPRDRGDRQTERDRRESR